MGGCGSFGNGRWISDRAASGRAAWSGAWLAAVVPTHVLGLLVAAGMGWQRCQRSSDLRPAIGRQGGIQCYTPTVKINIGGCDGFKYPEINQRISKNTKKSLGILPKMVILPCRGDWQDI